ncbi:EXPERA domain-containing protein [Pleurotus pulmonarius]
MMMPIFSATHASQLDALPANEVDGAGRSGRRKWRTVRTQEGYRAVPAAPWDFDMVAGHHEGLHHEADDGEQVSQSAATHVTSGGSLDWFPDERPGELSSSRPESSFMAYKTRTWISLWFLLTAPVIFWDVGYCFMRPRSMKGGDLHWIWSPYALYQEVDYIYGVKALQEGNGFTLAQSLLNIVETLMNLVYLYLAHVQHSPAAIVIGFAAVVMTLSKTVLYWAQEYYCGFCAVGHNSMRDLIVLWVIPNGLWIVFPAIISVVLGKDIARQLYAADRAAKKAALEKKR